MSQDLRRKLILKQLDKLNNNEEIPNSNLDTLGQLPSFPKKSISKEKQHTRNLKNDALQLPSWKDFFTKNEVVTLKDRNFQFNTYFTLPTSHKNNSVTYSENLTTSSSTADCTIPIYIFHHGAGSSGLSFANLAKEVYERSSGKCGCFSFDARGHGKTVPIDPTKPISYGREIFVQDFKSLITWFYQTQLIEIFSSKQNEKKHISLILVGHSLGGSICTFVHPSLDKMIRSHVLGVAMFDIVEEAAILALEKVDHFLKNTPNAFNSYEDAIGWYMKHKLSRTKTSAEIAVPSLFAPVEGDTSQVTRITNLKDFSPYWSTWFTDLSHSFVTLPTAKLLILAGDDRLDKELIIGQMQGKYQLVVFQDSGHFIQEDSPMKTALTLLEFWKRNDNTNVIIKSNWGSSTNKNQ
ncbi:phosphoprotein phosphatase methylesterase 1 NDAI_0C01940 [Naumovozyma dairenensis CBS 421]|uniref:Protein phosphatase methylesterase 1 n=1 Tax=Naumovozyma dairenensis (strain ATCC 10597 / BCRC 20456 / CBS 421 / NBRC 0211 / NRRL Y-12639) TaxID=1071378 RepID=G0W7U3_NAUDC|nr:hypothetical protein NDAI_0C01940 [Naumovozyma dairenensis CBS 421]CCD23854.1 hypothetical protein NDAI_0C01940 [Naumovozyma dairenensis CBS 421]